MKNSKDVDYTKKIIERLRRVMILANLEISGLSVLTGLSEGHIYALLSGRRNLTTEVADIIGSKTGFDGSVIFNLNQEIPNHIQKSDQLKNFSSKYKYNKEYFINTKIDRKPSYFLEFEVLNTTFLDEPKYVWEVNEFCRQLGRTFTSDKLKKHLKYFVTKGKLRTSSKPIKLRSGGYGTRIVDVFFK